MFQVTREFLTGNLAGLTYTETTSVKWKVGQVVRKSVSGGSYRIISVVTL